MEWLSCSASRVTSPSVNWDEGRGAVARRNAPAGIDGMDASAAWAASMLN